MDVLQLVSGGPGSSEGGSGSRGRLGSGGPGSSGEWQPGQVRVWGSLVRLGLVPGKLHAGERGLSSRIGNKGVSVGEGGRWQ